MIFALFDIVNSADNMVKRARPNGGFGETDMHGCQQHIPLGDIDIPVSNDLVK